MNALKRICIVPMLKTLTKTQRLNCTRPSSGWMSCPEMNSDDKFCLQWNDFQKNIKTSFAQLREDKDSMDVTLACEDGQLEAHKVILSSGSPFFKRLLDKMTNKHLHPFFFMRGLKTRQLTTMVDFRYAFKKKNDIIWEFFPNVGPPTPPFWEPLSQKKILVFILHFRT